jgi:uncharacterized protein (TIGR02246 family)
MKRSAVFVLPLLGFLLSCTQGPQSAQGDGGGSAQDMIAAANALDQSFINAFNEGDVDALASLYWNSPDVVVFPPDTLEAKGAAGVRQAIAQMFETMHGARFELTEQHQMPAGDVVIGWGLFRVTVPDASGSPVEMVGRYTDVKAERDGKWVYLLDHGSMPIPPSED